MGSYCPHLAGICRASMSKHAVWVVRSRGWAWVCRLDHFIKLLFRVIEIRGPCPRGVPSARAVRRGRRAARLEGGLPHVTVRVNSRAAPVCFMFEEEPPFVARYINMEASPRHPANGGSSLDPVVHSSELSAGGRFADHAAANANGYKVGRQADFFYFFWERSSFAALLLALSRSFFVVVFYCAGAPLEIG